LDTTRNIEIRDLQSLSLKVIISFTKHDGERLEMNIFLSLIMASLLEHKIVTTLEQFLNNY